MTEVVNGFAAQYLELVRRNFLEIEDKAHLSVGITRLAHPTGAGFKAIKRRMCLAICQRFRSLPTCEQDDDKVATWFP
ncbi:hypothetical protein TWF694_006322 [Orbilia ellipsospora]|uniref:Uncharacterized protein n=1 Tax=Orbilia ellipsospora TaxID=2528407 RepID=A0AAV9XJQ5_9PEZI